MIKTLFEVNTQVLLDLVVVPVLFITLLTWVNRQIKELLAQYFGMRSEAVLGSLGIIIHEASHLVVALLFGHHITHVTLLRFPKNEDPDLSLGSVNHTWNQNNLYQTVGNLFIGVAPIFGCTGALLALMAWLTPEAFAGMTPLKQNPTWTQLQHFLATISQSSTPWWHWVTLIILSLSICIGGFDLSTADYLNSKVGLLSYLVLIVALTSGLTVFGIVTAFANGATRFAVSLTVILMYSFILSCLTYFLLRIIIAIKKGR
ncbi:hypothetical protein [Levilactobacillus bambusae]|uniref:Uncharacterized protein n=1 Tax=Levilactobacillus bambusae TaxID=2024736 RepID=A0A2V1MYG0_9LACO|nr:hypothetical protein [Levilactobacillus bambusae]PWF99851.1 hypothetical protein DCM90_07260 [Levilactobacillus bambusae]